MNSEYSGSQLDAQIQKKRVAQVVEVSEAPTLYTSDIFETDDRTGNDLSRKLTSRTCLLGWWNLRMRRR